MIGYPVDFISPIIKKSFGTLETFVLGQDHINDGESDEV
ncbi:hypothetical protein ADU37_CDS00560 [Thermococcus sp. 2319x1]|nr:hypothetical protein ADU37_CDS00560 [Thermococcus sp. 2319x1]